jgi:hypothetical protein
MTTPSIGTWEFIGWRGRILRPRRRPIQVPSEPGEDGDVVLTATGKRQEISTIITTHKVAEVDQADELADLDDMPDSVVTVTTPTGMVYADTIVMDCDAEPSFLVGDASNVLITTTWKLLIAAV